MQPLSPATRKIVLNLAFFTSAGLTFGLAYLLWMPSAAEITTAAEAGMQRAGVWIFGRFLLCFVGAVIVGLAVMVVVAKRLPASRQNSHRSRR